ncbi:hypothetical protein BC332_21040 [Capsicum chinense]|nr:hypothetical protein BC332_21040 [Capsicum chinense]
MTAAADLLGCLSVVGNLSIQTYNIRYHSVGKEYVVSTLNVLVGPNNLEDFKKFAKQFQKQASGAAAGTDAAAGAVAAQEDEDEVPELVAGETFEAATKEGHTF